MKKTAGIVLLLVLSVIISGCAKKNEAMSASPQAPASQAAVSEQAAQTSAAAAQTAAQTAAPASVVDAQKARQIALQTVGVPEEKAQFTKVWQDYDDGIQEWEICFVSDGMRYEVELNAGDGSVHKTSSKPVESGSVTNGGISAEEAKKAAVAAAGVKAEDAVFEKIKCEFDDGIQTWELEFAAAGKEYEIELNAADGAVLEMSQEMLKIAQ